MPTDSIIIKISDEFSISPGGRSRKHGPNSGQQFYEELLQPAFSKCILDKIPLFIDFDDTFGYTSSWLWDPFSSLAQEYGDRVYETLKIKCKNDPSIENEIWRHVDETLYNA